MPPEAFDNLGAIWEVGATTHELVRHPAGNCSKPVIVRLQGVPPKIPAAQLTRQQRAMASRIEKLGAQPPRNIRWPSTYPGFAMLLTDATNNLWVYSGWPGGGVWVYSSAGVLLARVPDFGPLAPNKPMVIAKDFVYGFAADEDGVLSLVALRIRR